jgi:alkaline phosphatase
MYKIMQKILGAAIAVSAATAPTFAAEPLVKGPESVQDWFNQGQAFIRQSEKVIDNHRRARNVILFVGDGMGISTLTAARILDGQLNGKPGEENRLSFENFPDLGLSKTYSWDQQTSDSAPTMTAMVTGHKAREGMLSVDHLTARGECAAEVIAKHSIPTILEQAAAAGKSTGVVSTARLTHATPAATYSHTSVRDWESDSDMNTFFAANIAACKSSGEPLVKDIARQLIELPPAVRSSLKVAMGGGRTYFLPKTLTDPENGSKGRRSDGRDLTAEWLGTRGANAQYVWNKAGFEAVDPAKTEHLLGLFENSHMQYEADRANDKSGEPSLTEMTAKAIKMLDKNPRGYFLHVEAGRIDHAHHAGNAKRALLDTIELSKAVKKAYEMTDPRDTLIIVTADHSHTFTIAGYPHRGNDILGLAKEVPANDGTPVAPTKAGDGMPYTTLGYQNGPGAVSGSRADLTSVDTTALNYLQQAVVPMSSETHAGEDVAIYASGPKSYLVRGSMEQNWIYHVMKEAFGF